MIYFLGMGRVLQPVKEHHCISAFKDLIIKTTEDWVDKDDFLVNPPRKHVDELIFELTPEFVNGYVTSSFV